MFDLVGRGGKCNRKNENGVNPRVTYVGEGHGLWRETSIPLFAHTDRSVRPDYSIRRFRPLRPAYGNLVRKSVLDTRAASFSFPPGGRFSQGTAALRIEQHADRCYAALLPAVSSARARRKRGGLLQVDRPPCVQCSHLEQTRPRSR